MIKRVLLIGAACCLCTPSMAGVQSPMYAKNGARVVTLSAGPAWYQPTGGQDIALQSDIIKSYVTEGQSKVMAGGELFFALQYLICDPFYGQFGLTVGYTGNAKLGGDIWEDANPNFNNFSYKYQVNHGRLGIKGKLLANLGYPVHPYLSGSIAVGFNHAFGYSVTSKLFEEIPAPLFTSDTTTAFSYTAGIGLQMALNDCWKAALGYELTDFGKNQLGRAPGQTLNAGIKFDHLYTNQLLFSLSYLT